MTNSEISEMIDNDEGLYNWWLSVRSRMSRTKFIKENRTALVEAITNVRTGKKPVHYLAYDPTESI